MVVFFVSTCISIACIMHVIYPAQLKQFNGLCRIVIHEHPYFCSMRMLNFFNYSLFISTYNTMLYIPLNFIVVVNMANILCQWKMLPFYCIVLFLTLLCLWRYEDYRRNSGEMNDLRSYTLETKVDKSNRQPSSKEQGKNKTTHKKLSIDLVIVPFLKYSKAYGVSREKLTEREQEYRTVMHRNLNHPLVNRLHVLTTDPQETLRHFNNFTNQEKMIVAKVKSIDWMRHPFEYISLHLIGKDVMFANADIYLGDGFDLVDPEVMSHQNIMYALTRQIAYNEGCKYKSLFNTDLCREHKYIGSHDTFLFRLKKPLTEDFLENLEFTPGSLGMENVLIWAFKAKLNYCVLNPCRILQTFHLHCSGLRTPRKWVAGDTKNGQSQFTKKLACN